MKSLSPVDPAQRRQAARAILSKLRADTDAPAWSSFLLDQMFAAVMSVEGGEMADVILALYELLGARRGPFSETTANLISEVVLGAFSRDRASFERSDLSRMTADLAAAGAAVTPAQAYLMLHALPEEAARAHRHRIVALLADTPYADEADEMLAAD